MVLSSKTVHSFEMNVNQTLTIHLRLFVRILIQMLKKANPKTEVP
ncbi:hypothetical protein SAMN05444412_105152 [Rhodonellum ikkaensis]|uniref:Uncharacterized protein n=1 Tax=Rhodonellum ikkaensis TaxID=336829 RepID=A0A1H3Q1T1_9BACT|nr:hypothetical protein SAMN05444412_105152 [Rhodonellum ikkaensis]